MFRYNLNIKLENALIIFLIQIIFYLAILFCLDRNLIQRCFIAFYKKIYNFTNVLEDNVYTRIEREKVENPNNSNVKLTTILHNVTKVYRNCCGKMTVRAVNKV